MNKNILSKSDKEKVAIILTDSFTYKYYASHIIKSSDRNFIILGNFSNKEKKEEYSDTKKVKFINIKVSRKKISINDLLLIFKISRILKKNNIDKVITFMPKTNVIGQIASKLSGIKFSILISSGQLWISRHGIARLLLLYIERLTIMLCDILVADSKSQFNLLKKIHPGYKNKLRYVMGLKARDFKEVKPLKKKIKKLVIGHIGLFNKRKGTEEAIEIAEKCLSLDLNLIFRFVGVVDEIKFQNDIRKLKFKYPEKIVFKNSFFNFEKEISRIDILLMPSKWEGFGIAAVEAAKLRKIVIGYDVIGLKDSIINNKTGHRVKFKDQNSIIRLFKMYSENNKKLIKLQNLSYKISRERFKSNLTINKLIKILGLVN